MDHHPFRLPAPGDVVGGYRIVGLLGDGGQGRVYRAEAAGRFFALKFLERGGERWGEREVESLLRLKLPGVVGFLGCGRWPDLVRGSFYIVMELVEGLTLYDYVMVHNPTARKVAELVLSLGRTLIAVQEAGVLHRDVKRENIMVRLPSEEPVVLDFGLAALAGASSSMGVGQVTGTLEYVSPEAWRHACEEEEHYRPTAKDEQWALGVTFYWMLTDLLAFGGREDPLMTRRVLREQPKAPHVVNPRVPPELGALCMRLLEKNPEDRYADLKELCGAVRQVLEKAVDGAAWDVPLGQPDAPECRTTDIDVTVVAEGGIDLLLALIRAPRRGRVIQLPATRLLAVPPPVPLPEPAPVPAPVPIQRIAELPAVMAAVPAPAAWGRPVPALQGARRAASWTLLLLLGLVLGPEVSSVLGEPPARAPAPVLFEEPALWPGGPSNSLQPAGAGPPFVAWQVGSPGEKLASPPYPPQSGVGADKTPASAVEAAYREKEPHVKKSSAARKAVITLCTALTSCVGAPQIMRQDPPAEPCPPGAIKAMAEWMDIEFEFGFALPPEPNVFMPVKEGPFTAEAWSRRTTWKWQGGKVEGKIIFGPDRVHIRLTKAFTYDGKAFPICAQVHHLTAKEGEPHVILSTQSAKIVDRFE